MLELDSSRAQDIIDSVNKCLRVRIGYDDEKGGKGKNTRYIYPVAFGVNTTGNEVVRAFQSAGSSKRKVVPGWKLFRTDRIYSWDNGKKNFASEESRLLNKLTRRNKNGEEIDGGQLQTDGADKNLKTIYAMTPIGGSQEKATIKPYPGISSTPVQKQDIEPSVQQTPQQEPTVTPTKNIEKPIDKTATPSYTNKKIGAPPTEPISKQSIEGPQPQNNNELPSDKAQVTEPETTDSNTQQVGITDIPTEPISKDQIENPETEDNPEVQKMKDMMKRMDNVNKDEEEEI